MIRVAHPGSGSGSATLLLFNMISALDCGADDARLLLLAAEAGGVAEGAHLPRLSLRGGGPSASHLWFQVSSPSHSVERIGLRIHRAPTGLYSTLLHLPPLRFHCVVECRYRRLLENFVQTLMGGGEGAVWSGF
jgi:hypothetical protein